MSKPAYEVLEWDLARVGELFDFNHRGLFGAEWGIKGHNRPWILDRAGWQAGMRALDVGAGFSELPFHLLQEHQVEAWVADDYGAASQEDLWSRWGDPAELPRKYPGVRYVFSNLGQPVAELPEAYFDRVYSVSVLEHVPPAQIQAVLQHMSRLLKPGGWMLHTIDLPSPRTLAAPGWPAAAAMLLRLGLRDLLIRLEMPGYRTHLQSVEGWSRILQRAFRLSGRLAGISTLRMILDQDVLTEPPQVVYHFYPPNEQPKPFWRVASLKLILRRTPE